MTLLVLSAFMVGAAHANPLIEPVNSVDDPGFEDGPVEQEWNLWTYGGAECARATGGANGTGHAVRFTFPEEHAGECDLEQRAGGSWKTPRIVSFKARLFGDASREGVHDVLVKDWADGFPWLHVQVGADNVRVRFLDGSWAEAPAPAFGVWHQYTVILPTGGAVPSAAVLLVDGAPAAVTAAVDAPIPLTRHNFLDVTGRQGYEGLPTVPDAEWDDFVVAT